MEPQAPLILVVEDSPLVCDAMRTLFESTGRRVAVAGTISDAVAACTLEQPALMLLDVTLPDGDGISTLRRLEGTGATPRIVFAMTGHDDPATRQRCLDAGCAEVLVKPVPTRELLRRVGEALGAR